MTEWGDEGRLQCSARGRRAASIDLRLAELYDEHAQETMNMYCSLLAEISDAICDSFGSTVAPISKSLWCEAPALLHSISEHGRKC